MKKDVEKTGTGSIKITVRRPKKEAAYCGGGCNGCSCSRCGGAIKPPVVK